MWIYIKLILYDYYAYEIRKILLLTLTIKYRVIRERGTSEHFFFVATNNTDSTNY
jgi:hypothetical protein